MTDEERQKLILQRLAQLGTIGFHDPDIACQWILDGHDEIERLASIVVDYKMTFGDIHEVVMGAGITHEASHTDTENGEKSNAESAN